MEEFANKGKKTGEGKTEKEIKNYILHKHPIVLYENEGGKLNCYGCGDPLCMNEHESYVCGKCKFEIKCRFACGSEFIEGSYYFCKLYWPNTPLFHKLCVELPHEIQITFHPNGSLHLIEKYSSSTLPYKHTIDQSQIQNPYKFCCDVCSFEIGYQLALILMKYDSSHVDPLTLIEKDSRRYELCYSNNISGPIYACTCNFYIHKSCSENPSSPIRHPLHPFHNVNLLMDSDYSKMFSCQACSSQGCGDKFYQCFIYDEPKFKLHIECARSLTANIQYSGHKHLVTLINVNLSSQRRECSTCGFDILLGSPFLSCLECKVSFHVECGVKTLEQSSRGELLKHFSHPHVFVLCENEDNDDQFCYGCDRPAQGPVYSCDSCKLYHHKSCAELPREIQHRFHQHVLTLHFSTPSRQCSACNKYFNGLAYLYDDCDNFYLDPDCNQ